VPSGGAGGCAGAIFFAWRVGVATGPSVRATYSATRGAEEADRIEHLPE
jgi:hypothetical protein